MTFIIDKARFQINKNGNYFKQISIKTRLISIVSKPIIIVVVVVVIDVVFVKKKLGPKKFWLKKSMSKKLYAKIILGKKK